MLEVSLQEPLAMQMILFVHLLNNMYKLCKEFAEKYNITFDPDIYSF